MPSSATPSEATGVRRRGPLASRAGAALAWRLLLAEALLGTLEVALVGVPVVLLVRDGIHASSAASALLPWFGGLWVLSLVGSAGVLRPLWVALGIKQRQEPLSTEAAEGVRVALRRAP
jgi:hypothetical protein